MNRVKYQENYLLRSGRSVTTTPDISLTELIANAWDARQRMRRNIFNA